MAIVDITTAMHHLRADDYDLADVQHKLDAAQEIAEQFIGRRVYTDYPSVLAAANAALADMERLMAEKETILGSDIDANLKSLQLEQVDIQWYKMMLMARGIASNSAIEIAVLLILGTLYEHREDVVIGTSIVRLPQAAEHRLQPYRIMGV